MIMTARIDLGLRCTPAAAAFLLAWAASGVTSVCAEATEVVDIPPSAAETPFPHFWERMYGSGRAILSLRDGYRHDLRAVKAVTEFGLVRFHNIFHDEVGLYQRDATGAVSYNFSYVDQIYDGLLAEGVRPFVELSFMPRALSSDPKSDVDFWYHPNRAPPRSYARWDELVQRFTAHLVERYGIDEVAQWYFEVWNEPNIDFWSGQPKQATYFTLYDHTARAVKSVSSRLRVGGPSTAQAAWVKAFLAHAARRGVPVDFVSSHVYANDTAENVLHSRETVPRDRMVCRAVQKVHEEIAASPLPALPFILSEFNASYANEPNVTDSVYMGPWIATTVSRCDGLVDLMSYWSFSDVFEEQGVVKTPFYGGFGLLAEHGIPKPAFNAFALLHKLGDRRLRVDSEAALATRRADGTLVIALWNYAPPAATGPRYQPESPAGGPVKRFLVRVGKAPATARARVWRLDADHGNVVKAFDAMGRPDFPSRTQIEQLRAAGQLADPEDVALADASLAIDIPPQGLVLVELPSSRE
jgi:xylan 1,4-beta-xylosidase